MAYVLSSVSGNLISAASAGYAPTNSGDVSAIASAYQVVSATATQLYAGTAYVTSINDAPISAARAGNAANASLANSAYYDGTGRLISALPDSADVSAIASSYVESGVSSKQDTLSFAYNTADQISSINGSALGGMDEAAVSGIASAYAESAVSSKADSSALSSYVPYSGLEYYDTAISAIDGSSLYDYSAHARITTVAGRVTSLSAEMSSKADESALSGYYTTANESGFITGVDLTDYATTAYVDSSISGFAYDSAVSGWTAKQDALTFGYDTADKISSINGSSLAGEGGGGGLVTAIGTSESGITSLNNSGLVDTAALRSADYSSLYVQEPLYISASGDSSYIGISGTQVNADWAETASAAPSYIENKPDLVDIVAGPGIVVDNPDGNTLRVSQAANYEVTLFENASGTTTNIVCSEKMSNFDRVRFYLYPAENTIASEYTEEFAGSSTMFSLTKLKYSDYANIPFVVYGTYYSTTDSKTITFGSTEHMWFGPSWNVLGTGNTSPINVVKIVGVNRIANN